MKKLIGFAGIVLKMINKEAQVCATIWSGDRSEVGKNPNIETVRAKLIPNGIFKPHNSSLPGGACVPCKK